MAYSSGTFSRLYDWTTDRDAGVKIRADRMDEEFDGIATGLTTAILKDGTQTTTAVVPFAFGISIVDNKAITLGTNSDITIQYDETTNDSLEIAAAIEGAALGIVFKSDQGDDNADSHKLSIADGGTLTLASKISGSFVTYLTHTPNSTVASSTLAVAGNLTVGGSLTLGSGAVLSEAELEQLDGITAGTVAASKAMVVDANKDIGTVRNLTIDGTFSDGNYTFDTSGNVSGLGTIASGAITSSGIVTGTGFTAGSAVLAEAELELLDGLTAGTAIASKVVTTDANIDTSGQRNLTISGELDAGSLDVSGDADIDGTLEADAITVNGTALNTVIAGVTVTNATTAAVATTVTISDNESTNEENAVVFTAGGDVDGGNIGLESDGNLTYNPSTGTVSATIFKGNIDAVDGDFDGTLEADAITVNGTALATVIAGTTVTDATNSAHVLVTDNESTNEENLITFVEGATDSTGNVGLEMDGNLSYNPSTGTVTATVFKGNIDAVDGDFDGTLEADAITIGGTGIGSIYSAIAGSSNIVTTGALNAGSITSGFGAIDNGSSNITTTGVGTFASLDISGDIDVDGTANLDVVDIDGAVTLSSTVSGLDVNGTEIILDADADSSITADTDDQIDIKVGGTDTIKIEPDAVTILGPHPDLNLQDSDDNNTGGVYYNDGRITLASDNGAQHSGSSLVLSVDGTARVTVDDGGDVDIETGDIFFSTAGKGINLGVTSNTDSNTLDDYEEGTYTIAMTAANSGTITLNSSFNTGHYTKIGDTVTVHGHPKISSVSSPNGNTLLSLPFTAKNDNMTQGVSAMLEAGVTYQTNQTGGFMVLTSANTSTMTILYNTNGDFFGLQAQNGGLGANDQFRFSITYKVE